MNKDLMEELERLRKYEAATRDTICWGVHCVHEARAFNMIARQEGELDRLKDEIKNLKAELEKTKNSGQ